MAEGHALAEPFSYRTAQTVFAGIARTVRVNQASRRRPKPHVTVRYLEPDFTAMFLNGLAGLGPDGAVDRLFHGRELARNACVGGAGGGDRPAVAGVHLPAGLRGARVAVVADGGADCVPGADGGDQGPEVRNHLDLLRCARGRAAVPAAGPRRHRGGFGPVTAARGWWHPAAARACWPSRPAAVRSLHGGASASGLPIGSGPVSNPASRMCRRTGPGTTSRCGPWNSWSAGTTGRPPSWSRPPAATRVRMRRWRCICPRPTRCWCYATFWGTFQECQTRAGVRA